MDLSRRRLITAAATSAAAAGVSFVAATPAMAVQAPGQAVLRPNPRRNPQPTEYDRARKRQNPRNTLGCPLGRGY